jgi:bifunctional DNA primase/polymerase-like protein
VSAQDDAVAMAERELAVIPLQPGRKVPRAGISWPAVACSDPARVAAAHWLPGEGYGIACKASRVIGLDLDVLKPGQALPPEWQAIPGIATGADVLAHLCDLAGQPWPVTMLVATPRDGVHLYYRAPADRLIGNKAIPDPLRHGGKCPLIDVRGGGCGNGGYLAGPGTIIDERNYPGPDEAELREFHRGGRPYVLIHDQDPAPLPGWLTDLLDPPGSPPVARLPRITGAPVYGRMFGVVDRLRSARHGDRRNALLHWGACRAGEMVAAGELDAGAAEEALYLAAEENGHVAKHGERATRATIASGMRQGAAA